MSDLTSRPSASDSTFDMLEMDLETARAFLPLKPKWCHGDQSLEDAATLIALARLKKDGHLLEIGISAGEGASAALAILSDEAGHDVLDYDTVD